MNETLGEFEVLVLTGVIAAGENSYGMVVHEEVEGLVPKGRNVAIGAVYTTLGRLEDKGYVRSWNEPAGGDRGGRPRRYFEVTGVGQRVLREALKPMAKALEIVGGVV
jgi:DNA-binding PadR family transcriptional regulator